MSFEAGAMAARAGCNTLRGGFEIEDGALVVDQLAQTQMACDEAKQAQDVWVSALLEGSPTVGLVDDILTLSSDSVTVTLSEEAGTGG